MDKSVNRGSSFKVWLLMSFLTLLLVSFLHSSSAYQRPLYSPAVPDETLKKIIVDALRKEWRGFKFPKSAKPIRSFYNVVSPMAAVSDVLDTLGEVEERENLERFQKAPGGGLFQALGRDEQDDQLSDRKFISGGGISKNIYRLKDSSYPKLNEGEWEIEVPTGTRAAQQWRSNMFDDVKEELIDAKEDEDGKIVENEENDGKKLQYYLPLAQGGDKRAKRVMCHFKICNLGRRRRSRFSSTPQGWLS